MSERLREGVSASLNALMNACEADIVRDDNLLQRVCEHGVRHPVGHVDGKFMDEPEWLKRNHQAAGDPFPFTKRAECCGCCADWPKA